MNPFLRLKETGAERVLSLDDFPLTIGGEGAGLSLPGQSAGEPVAVLGVQDGRLFLQRTGQRQSEWLVPGMREDFGAATLVLMPGDPPVLLVQADLDNRTLPPDIPNPDTSTEESTDRVPIVRAAFAPRSETAVVATGSNRRIAKALGLLTLLALAIAVFIFGARAIGIRVITQPPDAQVAIRGGGLHPRLAGRFWVTPGTYSLEIGRPGYLTKIVSLPVDETTPVDVHVALTPAPSPVLLRPLPKDAVVSWDERRASGNPTLLEAGAHRLHIEAPRYDIYDARVEVKGGGTLQTETLALKPQWAAIQILSEPTGAQVRVDAQTRGVTPITLELDAGLRWIALSAANAKDWNGQVLVHGGVPQTVGPVRLSAPDATLTVVSVPAGAEVTVAGQYRGRTPVTASLAPGLDYEVTVQRAGFDAVTRQVDLRTKPAARVEVRLVAQLGEVTIKGEPADAQLRIDGRESGNSGQTLRLPAASTTIEVVKKGFDPFRTTLTPKPGYPQLVNYKLLPAGTTGKPVLSKSIKNPVGLELNLMPVGEFEMGSNRREPGRRSNEVQRHVRLKRSFYLATTEVTNGQFRRFREAHSSGIYRSKSLDLDTQPVVDVGWNDAVEFCNWLSAQEKLEPAYVKGDDGWKLASPVGTGYRLPTEAEWEFAARYDGTSASLRYPWGTGLPIAASSGNYADSSAKLTLDSVLENYTDGYPLSTAPGKFPPNILGLYDIGGNVAEWVNDFYTAAPPDTDSVEVDPTGPAQGRDHVVRGSSYRSASITELRLVYRQGTSEPRVDLGFRVARYAE